VAPAGAAAAVRQAADLVTGHHTDDAVARFLLEGFALGPLQGR
jgi:hydroxymethylpyrimidine pyrophosphatase-like HAD family hydrolase